MEPIFQLESAVGAVIFAAGERRLRIAFITERIARITDTEGRDFLTTSSLIVTASQRYRDYRLEEEATAYRISTHSLTVLVDKLSGALRYEDATGKLLTREPEGGGRWLTTKPISRNIFHPDSGVDEGQNVDGARATVTANEVVFDRNAFEARLDFVFDEDEALFGLGSHEEGYGNLRGRSRELYQQNMKAVVPYFVSTRGYGVLLDCRSLMTFHDDALGSYWWADVVDELDYYIIQGDRFDDITRGYHLLTGSAPMLPKWAFGYVQSKERYVNAQELVDVVHEYRSRDIPLDAIVLDWKSWPNGAGWGQKSFDPARFPDPTAMVDQLHAMHANIMVSIWPIMTGDCDNRRELEEHGLMLGNRSTYNAFLPEARKCYWEQADRGLFAHGVDAWWCDCTEPFEADWAGAVKPEPHARLAINTAQSKLYLDAGSINAYSLLHSQGIYEGQRSVSDTKRVVNLTRSSYAGQHRYGTITWNGDICGTWETLRRCIPEGLNFCATGEPYWTVDIGGFFVANDAKLWFWRGDYNAGCRGLTDMNALEPDPHDTGCTDLGYWELYTRWVQYAAFLPMFRSHGTDAAREIWCFGHAGTPFYDAIAKYIRLRYQLMPYLYSMAAQITLNSFTMLRALALAFPDDRATYSIGHQFMFGNALLICPVTRPMYYEAQSRPLAHVDQAQQVYLPNACSWFDFWTNALYEGGQPLTVDAPLETMPIFARAGSILPMAQAMQYVDQVRDAAYEIRVYRGADATFTLYEDAGDGYAYERGEYALMVITWNEASAELSLAPRQGKFNGMVQEREYCILFISGDTPEEHTVRYRGDALTIRASQPQP